MVRQVPRAVRYSITPGGAAKCDVPCAARRVLGGAGEVFGPYRRPVELQTSRVPDRREDGLGGRQGRCLAEATEPVRSVLVGEFEHVDRDGRGVEDGGDQVV